jgi:small subunit ribosomal protein S4
MVGRVRTKGGIVARYTDPVCRLCRREGMKLFLKGDRCFKDKCAIERRNYAPGQHGRRRSKVLGYGVQLREKQKVKRIYGLLERQFRTYFQRAERKTGITGENLLRQLELRLDNVAYSLGFASSRAQARQLVRHGHIEVNGRKINVPSYQARKGDVVQVREKSRKNDQIRQAVETAAGRGVPSWLQLNPEQFLGTVNDLPKREDIRLPIQEQLIVELYSK